MNAKNALVAYLSAYTLVRSSTESLDMPSLIANAPLEIRYAVALGINDARLELEPKSSIELDQALKALLDSEPHKTV